MIAIARGILVLIGAMVFFTGLQIATSGSELLTMSDLIYLAVLGAIVLPWWFLFSDGNSRTSMGQKAVVMEFHRFKVMVPVRAT